ncbi:MAG: acetate kinase [Clostridia bacterium]|nr:acetate kinase [Clostridia bacterium]
MKILVINCGSSSLKYQLIDMEDESVVAKGICERIGFGGHFEGKTAREGFAKFEYDVDFPTHTEAFREVTAALTQGEHRVLDSLDEISAVGHRIVQGGDRFSGSVLVTPKVTQDILELAEIAPLHNKAHVMGIEAAFKVFGENIPEVVVFDTAFHSTMPPEAYMFAIPYEFYEKYHIRRYGFHGTSHRYVSGECAKLMGRDISELKIVTCHLGNGSSITAVKGGKVIDTSMGLTPLDGLMMGTRSGGIDPSIIPFIAEKENLSPAEISDLIQKKSGYLGVSGLSSDDRDLKTAAAEGNERCALARKMLSYQIRKFIGSYIAAMEGIDAIVFTGGIGENADDIRADVIRHFGYLGIELLEDENKKAVKGVGAEISAPGSKIRSFVIPTNEELVIARDTMAVAFGK